MCDAKCKAVNDVNKADDLCEDCREGFDEHFADEEEDEEEDEDAMCSDCAGSGEGMYDGASCMTCHGTGSAGEAQRRQDCEDARGDYMYDEWKDRQMEERWEAEDK